MSKTKPNNEQNLPSGTKPSLLSRLFAPTRNEATEPIIAVEDGATDPITGFAALGDIIRREQIQEATRILMEYKRGKSNLERRIIDNEEWYRTRHWGVMPDKKQQVEPISAWLFNCIQNKHADAMDNFPSPNILPREERDKPQAKILSSIIPVILDQTDFEGVYNDLMLRKIKSGTGVYGIFWDSTKHNGLGDIAVRSLDPISLFWEPGVTDIQRSKNFFNVELVDNESLIEAYPQLKNKLSTPTVKLSEYTHDDTIDTTRKSAVIDWYYKRVVGGKTILHYCKYVNDEILFASENLPEYADGFYAHGLYPFVFDPLFLTEGTPTGFGYIDIGKNAQMFIDRGNQAIIKNMLATARPRVYVRNGAGINEEDFADLTKDVIRVDGNFTKDSIIFDEVSPLSSVYIEVLRDQIDALKETTGNRDISTGGTTSGVTAASAIAAMQEASGKLSRDSNKGAYRAFRQVCLMVIELIRQFYDESRTFRILGEDGSMQFVLYNNALLKEQATGTDFNTTNTFRTPLFDIEVTAQKQSPYSKMAQNELALQFFGAGFFNPQMADQALACIDMMDFDRKDFVMQKIQANGGMYQQMLMMQQQMIQLAQMVDQAKGTNLAEQIAAGMPGGVPIAPMGGIVSTDQTEALGGKPGATEASNTKKARQQAAETTAPR